MPWRLKVATTHLVLKSWGGFDFQFSFQLHTSGSSATIPVLRSLRFPRNPVVACSRRWSHSLIVLWLSFCSVLGYSEVLCDIVPCDSWSLWWSIDYILSPCHRTSQRPGISQVTGVSCYLWQSASVNTEFLLLLGPWATSGWAQSWGKTKYFSKMLTNVLHKGPSQSGRHGTKRSESKPHPQVWKHG